jgi:transcription-repair coupling factor (superfamily II helicase)
LSKSAEQPYIMAPMPDFSHLPVEKLLDAPRAIAGGVPEGLDALLLGALARRTAAPVLHVARDGNRLATL